MDEIKDDRYRCEHHFLGRKFSVRELGCGICVNPNTVHSALSELERSGLVASELHEWQIYLQRYRNDTKLKEDNS